MQTLWATIPLQIYDKVTNYLLRFPVFEMYHLETSLGTLTIPIFYEPFAPQPQLNSYLGSFLWPCPVSSILVLSLIRGLHFVLCRILLFFVRLRIERAMAGQRTQAGAQIFATWQKLLRIFIESAKCMYLFKNCFHRPIKYTFYRRLFDILCPFYSWIISVSFDQTNNNNEDDDVSGEIVLVFGVRYIFACS